MLDADTQGAVFSPDQMTDLLCDSVYGAQHTSDLDIPKMLRRHGAPWPEQLACVALAANNQAVNEDWPPLAVTSARSEGCTALTWSEFTNQGQH